jgi:hypothetical protein
LTETATATAAATAQQVFGAGQQLPHLQTVLVAASPLPELEVPPSQTVSHSRYPDEGYEDLKEEDPASMPKHSLVLGPGDAARIVQCCPNLRSLGALVVGEGVTALKLAPLLLLTQLTCLGIAGEGCDDAVAAQVLARLTSELRACLLLGPHVEHGLCRGVCGGCRAVMMPWLFKCWKLLQVGDIKYSVLFVCCSCVLLQAAGVSGGTSSLRVTAQMSLLMLPAGVHSNPGCLQACGAST